LANVQGSKKARNHNQVSKYRGAQGIFQMQARCVKAKLFGTKKLYKDPLSKKSTMNVMMRGGTKVNSIPPTLPLTYVISPSTYEYFNFLGFPVTAGTY
jgi:hypothetical protein